MKYISEPRSRLHLDEEVGAGEKKEASTQSCSKTSTFVAFFDTRGSYLTTSLEQ